MLVYHKKCSQTNIKIRVRPMRVRVFWLESIERVCRAVVCEWGLGCELRTCRENCCDGVQNLGPLSLMLLTGVILERALTLSPSPSPSPSPSASPPLSPSPHSLSPFFLQPAFRPCNAGAVMSARLGSLDQVSWRWREYRLVCY